jgi:putative DNA primase/helicase
MSTIAKELPLPKMPPAPGQDNGTEHAAARPSIEVRAGELPRLVREAEDSLLAARAGIYQRAGLLTRVVQLDEKTAEDAALRTGIKRAAGSVILTPATTQYLTVALARAADWTKWDARKKGMRACDPPGSVVNALSAIAGEWRLPILTGLIGAPTLRADGSLLTTPGYDLASGLYGVFEPGEFPAINPRPSREDAIAALEMLRELFSECAFEGGPHSAHAAVVLAATITACVRRSLPIAPAFGFSAPKRGTGKTTAAQAVAQVATGTAPAVLTWADDEAEFRKCLLSILLAGDGAVLIDNITHPVDSASLCAVLTSPTYKGRMLGLNQTPVVSTATVWTLTGNHLEVVGDLVSRTLLCVLDAETEHPEARPFKRFLGAYISEHRGKLLAAALSVPLGYLAAGSPDIGAPRSRFPEWDAFVRKPLLWLGVADPLGTQAELAAGDPVREGLLGVLRAWHHAFGDEPTSVKRATEAAMELNQQARPDLHEALHAVAGEKGGAINNRRLGRYLVRNARRIEDGLRIEIAEPDYVTKNQRFRIGTLAGVSGVSGVPANPSRAYASDKSTPSVGTNTDNTDNTREETPEARDDDIPF